MKRTITTLCAAVNTLANEISAAAEAMPADPGVHGCEAVLLVRDAQAALNKARDRLALCIGNGPVASESLFEK